MFGQELWHTLLVREVVRSYAVTCCFNFETPSPSRKIKPVIYFGTPSIHAEDRVSTKKNDHQLGVQADGTTPLWFSELLQNLREVIDGLGNSVEGSSFGLLVPPRVLGLTKAKAAPRYALMGPLSLLNCSQEHFYCF
jgi:hypothetical protein